jgi:chitinase
MNLLAPAHPSRILQAVLMAVIAVGCASAHARPHFTIRHDWRPLLVGYLPNASFYSPVPFYLKKLMTSGSAARLNQINYASAAVHDGHCSISDPLADLGATYTEQNSIDGRADDPSSPFRGYFHQLQELKRKYPRLKILISLEGRPEDFASDAQPENRVAFVRSCVNLYLRGNFASGITKPGIFDGIDIDWETPHLQDAANFRELIEEFRRQMDAIRPGLRLSVAVDQSPAMLQGTDFAALAIFVDQFGIMNYDYSGPWSSTTGLVAPLFTNAPRASIQSSIAAYKALGVPVRKLLMGVPFYGYGWTDVTDSNNGLFQTGRAVHGDRPYNVIRTLAMQSQVFRDSRSQAPWIFDGQDFWTYEDPVSVRYKVSYAVRQKMGGIMIWELSGDTDNAELLNSVYRSMLHPLRARIFTQGQSSPPKKSTMIAQR